MATEPTPTYAEIGEVMQLVLQCTDARLAWDSDATAESYAAWKASLAAVRDRLTRWGAAQPAPADSVLEDAARYRWLRTQDNEDFEFAVVKNPHFDVFESPGELDAAIDAARKQGANHD